MNEDEIITRLVDFHERIEAPAAPPEMDAQRGQRLVRRRQTVSGLAAAAAVVLIVGIVQVAHSDGQRSQDPAPSPSPSPTESPSTGQEWTPERVRAEGSPVQSDDMISTEYGLTTRVYQACDAAPCGSGESEDLRLALEVSQDGRSAVFDLFYSLYPWIRVFGEDSVLVQDARDDGFGEPKRFRLLKADGTAVELEQFDDPSAAVPGPGVFLIGGDVSEMFVSGKKPYVVDDRAETLRPLDVPEEIAFWGPNVEEFLWGGGQDCVAFWATEGAFEQRRLDCSDGASVGEIHADEFPPGWLQPARMAFLEESDTPGADQDFVHLSLDRGATWQRIPVTDGETVTEVLQRNG